MVRRWWSPLIAFVLLRGLIGALWSAALALYVTARAIEARAALEQATK